VPHALSEVEVEAVSGRPSPLPKSRAQRGSPGAGFARVGWFFQNPARAKEARVVHPATERAYAKVIARQSSNVLTC